MFDLYIISQSNNKVNQNKPKKYQKTFILKEKSHQYRVRWQLIFTRCFLTSGPLLEPGPDICRDFVWPNNDSLHLPIRFVDPARPARKAELSSQVNLGRNLTGPFIDLGSILSHSVTIREIYSFHLGLHVAGPDLGDRDRAEAALRLTITLLSDFVELRGLIGLPTTLVPIDRNNTGSGDEGEDGKDKHLDCFHDFLAGLVGLSVLPIYINTINPKSQGNTE